MNENRTIGERISDIIRMSSMYSKRHIARSVVEIIVSDFNNRRGNAIEIDNCISICDTYTDNMFAVLKKHKTEVTLLGQYDFSPKCRIVYAYASYILQDFKEDREFVLLEHIYESINTSIERHPYLKAQFTDLLNTINEPTN